MKYVVACCWPPDKGQGISTISREIAESLVKQGDEIFYLSPKTENLAWHEGVGVTPIFIGPELSPKAGLAMVISQINTISPDALINNDHPYVQAALPALHTRKIIISHNMGWGTAALVRFNHKFSDNVIAISNDMLLMLLDKGIPPEKLTLIMNGINDPHNADWLPTYEPDKPLNLIFAGNWSKEKGADLLLDFILNMPDRAHWLELNIFGHIKNNHINRMADKRWIRIHGHVPHEQFVSALANADILLFPSKREGCPMTIIEAMSRGVVPIASDGVGAMRWMIDHGIDGFIARRKHWKIDLYAILEFTRSNYDFLHMMKLHARQRYKRQFDVCYMAERIKMIASRKNDTSPISNGPYQTIHWHRPYPGGSNLTKKIIDILSFRLGILRKSGHVHKHEIS